MQKTKLFSMFVAVIIVSVIVPQMALAAWWNPFSWNWGKLLNIFYKQNQVQIEKQIEKVKDETADWKTYTNTEYGFEVKYPKESKIVPNNPTDYFVIANLLQIYYTADAPNERSEFFPELVVTVIKQPFSVDKKIYNNIDDFAKNWTKNKTIKSKSIITLGSKTGLKISGTYNDNDPTTSGFFNEILVMLSNSNVISIDYADKFSGIASTFKFTTPEDQIAKSLITVISPNGGEQWLQGTSQTILWNGDPSKKYNIFLDRWCPSCMAPTNLVGTIATNITGNSFNWNAGNLLNGNMNTLDFKNSLGVPTKYVIRIIYVDGTGHDSSDAPFTMATSTQLPITVTWPNGGEQWVRGSYQIVAWATSNIPDSSLMIVSLRNEAGVEYNLTNSTVNKERSYGFTLPSSFVLGKYKAEVKTSVNNQSYSDSSNDYFSIVNP